jgi:O-antigen/teichoic acid export membrane protein
MESNAVTELTGEGQAPPGSAAGQRIGRNVAALAGGQLVTWTMTLAWTLVVPRVIGPAGIGIIVSAMSVTGILAIALGFGTRNYIVRTMVVSEEEIPALVATATVLRLLLLPLFLVAVIVYAHFAHYGHDGTVVLFLAAGATMLTLIAEPLQAAFQATERMKYLAYSDIINKSAQGLVGIVLALIGLGALGFAGCWLVMSGVVVAVDVFWLARYFRLNLRTSVRRLARMAKESVAYWAFGMFFMVYLWIDTAMLSLMTNPTVVGWYGVPTRLFQTFMVVPVLMSTAWLPRLVSVFERNPRGLPKAARTPTELALVVGLPIAAGFAVAAGPMIRLLYGPAYANAVPVMVILGLCIPPMYLNIMLSQMMIAAKRQVVWTWMMAGATVFNPVVNALLIPITQHRFGNGAIGAALALLDTELAIAAAGLVIAGKGVIGRAEVRRLSLVTIASASMWGVSFLLRGLGAAPSLAAGCLTLVLLIKLFRVPKEAEIAFARNCAAKAVLKLPHPLRRRIGPLFADGSRQSAQAA